MANLQENNTYQDNSQASIAAKLPSLMNSLKKQAQTATSGSSSFAPQYRGLYAPTDNAVNTGIQDKMMRGDTSFNVGEPIAPQSDPTSKTEALPKDYGSFWKTDTQDPNNPRWVAPTSEAKLRNWPTDLGGGQYVVDPTQQGKLIKSERGLETNDKILLRGGLSPLNYQIDHIIPLWLGGADTTANMQVLDNMTHQKKTNAQAVALTLLSSGKIDLNEAKSVALSWKNRDASGLPKADDYGMLPIDVAQAKYDQWKKEMVEGVKPKVTFKEVMKGIPEATKNWGKGWLPDFVREPIKGFVSGLTAGVVPYQPGEGENMIEKGLGYTGNIVGSIVGFGKFVKGIQAAKSIAAGLGLKSFMPKAVTSLAVDLGAPTMANANKILKADKWNRILRDAGYMTAYGQTAQTLQDVMPWTPEEQKGMDAHIKRFFFDAAYGGLLGNASQSLRGYAGVGAGSLTLGLIGGDNIEDALLNSAVMTGLHGVGRFNNPKRSLESIIDDEATKSALATFNQYAGKEVPVVKKGESLPKTNYTLEQIESLQGKALESLNKLAANSKEWDVEDIARERAKIIAAGRQLYKRTLPPEARKEEDVKDILSLGEMMKNKTSLEDFTTPESVLSMAKDIPLKRTTVDATPDLSTIVSGTVPATGYAGQIAGGRTRDNVMRFSDALKEGKAVDRVFIVDRPELEPFMRGVSNAYDDAAIKAKEALPMKNPQNALQVFGVMESAAGREVIPLGWVSRKFRIADSKYAFNNEKPNPDNPNWKTYDPEFNKDTIADAMRKNGVRVLSADIGNINTKTVKAQQPFLELNIKPENWAESLNMGKKQAASTESPSMPELISKIKTSQDAKEISATAKKIVEKIQGDADEVIMGVETPGVDMNKSVVVDVLGFFKNALRLQNPTQFKEVVNNQYGNILDDITAKRILANKDKFSVREVFNLLRDGIQQKRASPGTTQLYTDFLIPFFKSDAYKNNIARNIFPDLPVAGKASLSQPAQMPKKATDAVMQVEVKAPKQAELIMKAAETSKAEPLVSKTLNPDDKRSVLKRATSPKEQRVEAIREELTLRGNDLLENIDISQRDFNRGAYIKALNDAIRGINIDINNKNLPKDLQISQTEYAKIKKGVTDQLKARAEELVASKFNAESEINSGFLDKRIAELPTDEAQITAVKADTRKKLGILDEKEPEMGAKPKEKKPFPDKKGSESFNIGNFAKTVQENIKKFPKDSYAYGYAKMLDEGMKKAFGDAYGKSWALDPYFSMSAFKGKNFFGNLYKTTNENMHPRSQPKENIQKFVEKRREKGLNLTDKDKEELTAARKKEVAEAAEGRQSIENDAEAQKIHESGLSIKDAVQGEDKNLTDLTRFDELSAGRLSGEIGRKTDALDSAQDARGFLSNFISEFNRNVEYDNKNYGTNKKKASFTDLKSLEEVIKSESEKATKAPKVTEKVEEPKAEDIDKSVMESMEWLKERYPKYFK